MCRIMPSGGRCAGGCVGREKKGHLDPMKSARRVEDKSSYGWVIVALMLASLVILSVLYLFGRYILGKRWTLFTIRNIPQLIP